MVDTDVASLLREIRNISNKLQVSANVYDALNKTKTKYFKYYQDIEESNIKYLKNIKDLVTTIEHYVGDICSDSGLLKHEKMVDSMVTTLKAHNEIVRAKVLGCAIIKRAKTQKYGELLKNLRTQHSYGRDLYPNTVEIAHNMLNKHEVLNVHKRK